MLGALKLLEMAVPTIVGIVLGWVAATLYADVTSIPAARQEGVTSERIVWQERQRRAEAKAEADRAKTQAEIDATEAEYLRRDAERSAQMASLEQALQEELTDVPAPTPSPGGAAACRPAISRGVSERLNGVGRAAPGKDPGQPDRAVH